MKDNIVLCGFMGCGKTTVGKKLSRLTRRPLADTDKVIRERAGFSVIEIFEVWGEPVFREMEHRICLENSKPERKIISVGGGTVNYPRNVQELKKGGIIVFLDADLENLQKRLANDIHRPVLQVEDRTQVVERLYKNRINIYREVSDVSVNANQTIDYVALEIMKKTGIL